MSNKKAPDTCFVPFHQRQLSSKYVYQQIYSYNISLTKKVENGILSTSGFVRERPKEVLCLLANDTRF